MADAIPDAALELDGRSLDLGAISAVSEGSVEVRLADSARERMQAARQTVLDVLHRGEPVYGVTTGFGDLATVRISDADTRKLQENLLLSHAAGMGEPLDDEVVRVMLVLRVNALAQGHSGARVELAERLLELGNRGLLPVVPSRGSVGASGDLAPLAHLALPLIGHGRVRTGAGVLAAAEALREQGLEPLVLEPKEGLALINGTQAMTAVLALAVLELRRLVRTADLVGALTTDAFRGTDTAFDRRLHAVRPHPGQQRAAENLWNLLRDSEIRESHRHGDVRIQDPYSIRCMPQVHGAVRDVLSDIERRVEIEMNSVTDNPLVFPDQGEILSGGNFHGEPMAMAADQLAIAAAELGAISERRTEKLTNGHFSGQPPFLVREAGINSGFMIAQVTAAALASENKTLAHPASVDSIPTSAEKEDHVSMGMWAALKARQVVRNLRRLLAIELAAAAQGIDLLRPLRSSPPLEALHASVRERVDMWDWDREMAPDLERLDDFLAGAIDPHLAGLE